MSAHGQKLNKYLCNKIYSHPQLKMLAHGLLLQQQVTGPTLFTELLVTLLMLYNIVFHKYTPYYNPT